MMTFVVVPAMIEKREGWGREGGRKREKERRGKEGERQRDLQRSALGRKENLLPLFLLFITEMHFAPTHGGGLSVHEVGINRLMKICSAGLTMTPV